MSAFSQPRREPASSTVIKHAPSFHMQLLSSILSFTSHLSLFSNKVVISPEADTRFLFQFVWHVSGAVLLLRRSGDESVKAPCEEEKEAGGRRAGITPCSAVIPIYSPWHLRGHALTSAGISLPLCAHSCVFSVLRGNSTKFHVHYKSFQEAPVTAWSHLDCRDCCLAVLPSCGVGSDSVSMAVEFAVVVSLNLCFLC